MSARQGGKPGKARAAPSADTIAVRSNAALDGRAEAVIAYEPPVAGLEACEVCKCGQDGARMILCDRCNCGFHTYCLDPPLSAVPAGEWLCVDCMGERFGFGDGGRYTFARFAREAHLFKRGFFEATLGKRKRGEPPADAHVPPAELEWQFWNAVGCPDKPLQTLYGSDLDSEEVGSGFPTLPTGGGGGAGGGAGGAGAAARAYAQYAHHGWNANEIGRRSLLSALGVGISGMVVPWLYVGMLFSAFCWHVEDHLCHSVNYMHLGADKTW